MLGSASKSLFTARSTEFGGKRYPRQATAAAAGVGIRGNAAAAAAAAAVVLASET